MSVIIENTKPKLTHLGKLRLKPGFNTISDSAWAQVAESKFVKAKLACGDLKLIDLPTDPEAPADDGDDKAADVPERLLSRYGVGEAVKIVLGTFDRAQLEAWALEESRKKVLDAIEKQLEAIEPKDRKQE